MLYLHGASGTTYLYIHLNNDLTTHNDNRGKCVAGTAYAPGLKTGSASPRGSSSASSVTPATRTESIPTSISKCTRTTVRLSIYPFLQKAQPLLFYAKQGTTVSVSLTGTIVSSFGGVLELKASEVQLSSSKPVTIRRTLALSVAADAVVTNLIPAGLTGSPALLAGAAGEGVHVPVAGDARCGARRRQRPHRVSDRHRGG